MDVLLVESLDENGLREFILALQRRLRSAWCCLIHGGHELYRARTSNRLYQQCLLCGYETTGWKVGKSK